MQTDKTSENKKKNFKKTVIPFAIAEFDRLSKSKQGTGKFLDALYTFLTIYNTEAGKDQYESFKSAIQQGTAQKDSIEMRKQFFRSLSK